jgi:hypothetical protein
MMHDGAVRAKALKHETPETPEPEALAAAGSVGNPSRQSLPEARRRANAERLDYIADMITQIRDLSSGMGSSSLPRILDAALLEARLQQAREGG